MSLTLFDLEPDETPRAPARQRKPASLRWHYDADGSGNLHHADGTPVTDAEIDAAIALEPRRCRDCGRPENRCPRAHRIEGIRDGRLFILCDDCAAAEGRWGL